MKVVPAQRTVVKPTVSNTNLNPATTKATKITPSSPIKTAKLPRANTVATYQEPLFISIRDVQKLYLPMLSLKRIRKIVNLNVHTIKAGNKILVNREQLEVLLRNPEIKTI